MPTNHTKAGMQIVEASEKLTVYLLAPFPFDIFSLGKTRFERKYRREVPLSVRSLESHKLCGNIRARLMQ